MRRFIVIVMGKRNRSVLVLREQVKFGCRTVISSNGMDLNGYYCVASVRVEYT